MWESERRMKRQQSDLHHNKTLYSNCNIVSVKGNSGTLIVSFIYPNVQKLKNKQK